MTYPSGMLLDVGARDRKQPNFIGIDWEQRPGIDIVHDLEDFPYPLKEGSCLTIKCAHVIEHIKPWLVLKFMNELWRLLIVDGQLFISAPYAGSPGFNQDPTHCTHVTERTWQLFDPGYPLYLQYRPKPWKLEHSAWKPDGNIEAIFRKKPIKEDIEWSVNRSVKLTDEAIRIGAVQKPLELGGFIDFVGKRELKTVVEIGTARGGTLYVLYNLAQRGATIVSIDLPNGPFGAGDIIDEVKKLKGIKFIRKDSHKVSTKNELLRILGKKKIDLLFIDGDHTYEGVKKDWNMYSPLVKEDGLVVFHDICVHVNVPECQVHRLWRELTPLYESTEFIDPNNISWGGIGVLTYRRKV